MASWNGGTGDAGQKPASSTQKTVQTPEYQPQVSEENVIAETEDVFNSYLHQRWQQDQARQGFISTPNIPQITQTRDPMSTPCQVGRELARIGDIINQRHQDDFDLMIRDLNINSATAYDKFAKVANKLFEDGLNWGRILALFSFGYRIIVKVLGFSGIADFGNAVKSIVFNVVKYITDTTKGIVQWIASRGGWTAALKEAPSTSTKAFIGMAVVAGIVLAYVWYRRTK